MKQTIISMSKGNSTKFFPGKLHIMLDEVEGLGLGHGSSWVCGGSAFAIHDPDVFMSGIAPQFFDKQSHLRSFHRQLSIWGFSRLETGPGGRGVWCHKYFIRDKPELIKHIKRVPVKKSKQSVSAPKNKLPDYTGYKLPVSLSQDPARPKAATKSLPVYPNVSASTVVSPNHFPVTNKVHVSPRPLSVGQSSSLLIGHMPVAVPTRFASTHQNAALPVPKGSDPSLISDQARSWTSSSPTSYQPSGVSSMTRFSLSAVNFITPPTNNLSEVAQQLLSFRCTASAHPPTSLGGGSSNLNSELLAMILETREARAGFRQDLSAIAQQDQWPAYSAN